MGQLSVTDLHMQTYTHVTTYMGAHTHACTPYIHYTYMCYKLPGMARNNHFMNNDYFASKP